MPADTNAPLPNTTPKTLDQLLAELFRENARLERQVEDARHERDQFKMLYLHEIARHAVEPTPEEIAAAVPAEPFFEDLIRRLEKK